MPPTIKQNKDDDYPYNLYSNADVHHIHGSCLSPINWKSFPRLIKRPSIDIHLNTTLVI